MTRRRVVVTGLGATTPLGGDVATTWAGLLAGKSGVRSLTEDWAQTIPVTFAPKARIIPLDQRAMQGPYLMLFFSKFLHC